MTWSCDLFPTPQEYSWSPFVSERVLPDQRLASVEIGTTSSVQLTCLYCMMFWTVFGLWRDLLAKGFVLNSASYRIGWSNLTQLPIDRRPVQFGFYDTNPVSFLDGPLRKRCRKCSPSSLYWVFVYNRSNRFMARRIPVIEYYLYHSKIVVEIQVEEHYSYILRRRTSTTPSR